MPKTTTTNRHATERKATNHDSIRVEATRELDARFPAIRKGQAIAIGLIEDLGTLKNGHTKGEDCSLDPQYGRPAVEADNVLLRYLEELRAGGDRELEAGFLMVISDYIGTCASGVVPDVEQYTNFLSLKPARLRFKARAMAR